MSLPSPRLFQPSKDMHLLPQIAQIQMDCITHDGQLATFLPPLSHVRVLDYWKDIAEKVEQKVIVLVLQMAAQKDGHKDEENETEEVAGYVGLAMPWSETGPFRGLVQKLMVSPRYRRMGVARRVMEKLEEAARERERWLLTLDTTVGTPAEQVYPRLGWTEFGIVPKYGISPVDGSLVDEKFFYKDLRRHNKPKK